jgi:hypothetical protein
MCYDNESKGAVESAPDVLAGSRTTEPVGAGQHSQCTKGAAVAAIVKRVASSRDALPVCPCLWLENPYRLVSLWDMTVVYGYVLSSLATMLASFGQISQYRFVKEADASYRQDDMSFAESFLESLRAFVPHMRSLNLTHSLLYANWLIRIWETVGFNAVVRENMIAVLLGRLNDELRSSFFLHVPKDLVDAYTAPLEGWEEVVARFPSSTMDVEEMNRCFALSRYAAAVFHSVNAIECGLIELGKFLEVTDPKSGWRAVTDKLEILAIKTKFPDLDPKFQTCRPFLEQLYATLIPLQNAWRNKISHAQGRLVVMTAEFTPEVAEEIIVATRAFMRRLATEMPCP